VPSVWRRARRPVPAEIGRARMVISRRARFA
jgi:hypothetical protein